MPWVNTGYAYVFPYALAMNSMKAKEGTNEKKLVIELVDLGARLRQLEQNELYNKEEIVRLRAENEFMLRLINQWKINE